MYRRLGTEWGVRTFLITRELNNLPVTWPLYVKFQSWTLRFPKLLPASSGKCGEVASAIYLTMGRRQDSTGPHHGTGYRAVVGNRPEKLLRW